MTVVLHESAVNNIQLIMSVKRFINTNLAMYNTIIIYTIPITSVFKTEQLINYNTYYTCIYKYFLKLSSYDVTIPFGFCCRSFIVACQKSADIRF